MYVYFCNLDEVDRLLSVVGKYATTEEKRKSNENDNLTELVNEIRILYIQYVNLLIYPTTIY